MMTATVSAIPATEGRYSWTWHCATDKASSTGAFAFYYECVLDAQGRGYAVDHVRAQGATAPGGAGYALHSWERST